MLAPLLVLGLIQTGSPSSAGPVPFCEVLGRPLSWDPYGVYPLDAETPLTEADKEIVASLQKGELSRVEFRARKVLSVTRDDLLPAWALTQVLRVRKQGLKEYNAQVRGHVTEPAPVLVLLYRFHVCRIAFNEFMPGWRGGKSDVYDSLHRDLVSLRDRCRGAAKSRLGLAIGLTNSMPFWVLSDREILQSYRAAHPDGPDVRPLLCRAYFNGVVPISNPQGLVLPDAPAPAKALEIASSILKDRAHDALGLYYRGRAYFVLDQKKLAVRDIGAALDTQGLPPIFQQIATEFLRYRTQATFYSVTPVD